MLDFIDKNIWIYGFGSAGKWVSDNIKANIKGFIDSGSAKHKLKYKNLDVISPDKAKSLVQKDDIVLITVLDIQDVIPVLKEKLKDIEWIAIGEKLNDQEPINKTVFICIGSETRYWVIEVVTEKNCFKLV